MIKKTIWAVLLGLPLATQALTLDEALTIALKQSPELRAVRADAQAAAEEIRLASLWENPELELEAEGIGGDNGGTGSAEYTAVISQEVPMAGKLRKNRAVANYAADAARLAVREISRDFEARVCKAFANLQASEKILAVRAKQVMLAEDFLTTAQKRYEAGVASEMEVLRADMELEEKRGDQLAAGKLLDAARSQLARLTGLATIGNTEGDFFQTLKPSGMAVLNNSYPVLQRFQTLEKKADAELAREKTAWIPDVTLSAGARYEEDGNIQTYLVGVGIPLPLFNRGRAGRAAASFRLEAARAETDTVRRELAQELDALIVDFETASAEALRIREILLPKAERAAELCKQGYAAGRYGWVELIEMQQMLGETHLQNIAAQHAAWTAHIELSKFKP